MVDGRWAYFLCGPLVRSGRCVLFWNLKFNTGSRREHSCVNIEYIGIFYVTSCLYSLSPVAKKRSQRQRGCFIFLPLVVTDVGCSVRLVCSGYRRFAFHGSTSVCPSLTSVPSVSLSAHLTFLLRGTYERMHVIYRHVPQRCRRQNQAPCSIRLPRFVSGKCIRLSDEQQTYVVCTT